MSIRPRGTDSARVIQVIETTALRGGGTEKDTCRQVRQYWDFEGNFLAENDPAERENDQPRTSTGIYPDRKESSSD